MIKPVQINVPLQQPSMIQSIKQTRFRQKTEVIKSVLIAISEQTHHKLILQLDTWDSVQCRLPESKISLCNKYYSEPM